MGNSPTTIYKVGMLVAVLSGLALVAEARDLRPESASSIDSSPSFDSFSQPLPGGVGVQPLTGLLNNPLTNFVQSTLGRLSGGGGGAPSQPLPQSSPFGGQSPFGGGQSAPVAAGNLDPALAAIFGSANNVPQGLAQAAFQGLGTPGGVNLEGIASGSVPGIAPIPVPGFPGPSEVPAIPGVNTIPGLNHFNYLIGQLIPGIVPSTNKLLGGSVGRLLPQDATKNMVKDVFKAIHPPSANVDVDRMMGRWFQVINSPHVIREACTVSHFGRLTNENTYSANFTQLKFYREGNPNGPPRFSIAYGFKSGEEGQFVVHSSNSADSEPFWVVAAGPLNEFNQYDYAIVSNWVKFPVYVIARDPQRFQQQHMHGVLQYLEENGYINVLTKAFRMISPVDYSQCQYTPTFSGAG